MTVRLHFAPIRGITTKRFFSIFATHFEGVDGAVAPFIKPVSLERKRRIVANDASELSSGCFPVTPQLLAGNARQLMETAAIFFDAGYTTVNWNLGCPYPMVTQRKQGAGLLPWPEMVVSILNDVMPHLLGKLTIKARVGLDDPTELQTLLPRLAAFELGEIIIHGRTASQMYDGAIRLDALKECMSRSPFPVVANGDIDTVDAYQHMRQACPDASGFMIGRGLLRNPYLAQQIRGVPLPADETRRQTLRRFHDALFDHYQERLSGDKHLLQKMVSHWVYFSDWFANSAGANKLFRKAKTIGRYRDAVDKLFGEVALRVQCVELDS